MHPEVPLANEITGGIADFSMLHQEKSARTKNESKEFSLPNIRFKKGKKTKNAAISSVNTLPLT